MIKLTDELKNDFLIYAQEVNNNRAFPDARDGLKVSQRAVLWEMYDKNYISNKPHVKSAKVDGGVIANWHPHGSEYLTIVRMSQPWVNNISEIDFHGANGSLIGGPDAAASRYTECRLSKASEDGFFTTIKKNTTDFIKNYSEDLQWPSVFPSIFPRLMVNGSQGIGYTIAQEWEPTNLNEFFEKVKEYISKGKITYNNIYPDYPTGGIIINKDSLEDIYKTGKGTVILRGKAEINGNCINITELPYQVYAEPFIQKIKDLVNNGQLSGIEDICNKSDDNGLLLEIECSDDADLVLKKLYKLTDLQTTFSANQMALVDGIPQMLNLKDYIKVYVDHNINCLQREYKYDLDKATARKEIVDGLVRAISIIDDIIATIKSSKSSEAAKQDLINNFKFTENQAKAIVDMRLGKLAGLEITELHNELKELETVIVSCETLLADTKLQNKEFIKRLAEFVDKYGWERRTEITQVDLEIEKAEVKVREPKLVEYFNLVLENNYIKKLNNDNVKKYIKANPEAKVVTLSNADRLVLISNKGTMYKLPVKKLDICSANATGNDLSQLVDEKIIAIYSGKETEKFLFMITKLGLAKKILSETVFSLSKNAGAPIMKVSAEDEIIDCRCINSEKITINNGKKDKTIDTDDFIDKGRSAGGVSAVKPAAGYTEVKIKAGN